MSSPRRTAAARPARERILEAAFEEFAQSGLKGVRIEHVARRAGCNKSLVYRHFRSREELFVAVLAHGAQIRATARAVAPNKLADAIRYWYEHVESHRQLTRLQLHEALAREGGFKRSPPGRRRYYESQLAYVKERQRAGELSRDLPADLLVLMFLSLLTMPSALPQVADAAIRGDSRGLAFRRRWLAFVRDLARRLG